MPHRMALDALTVGQVVWSPYDEHRGVRPLHDVALYRGWIRWGSKMHLHLPDRVLRQFGHVQTIPRSPGDFIGHTTTPEEMDIRFTQYQIHTVDPGPPV